MVPTNRFVSATKKSMKYVVNWIPLRIHVLSRNTQPHLIKVGMGIVQITSVKRCPQVWPKNYMSLCTTKVFDFASCLCSNKHRESWWWQQLFVSKPWSNGTSCHVAKQASNSQQISTSYFRWYISSGLARSAVQELSLSAVYPRFNPPCLSTCGFNVFDNT